MRIAVLAGNREEFRALFKKEDEDNLERSYYYISELNYRGMSFDEILVIGSFWQRKNAKRLYSDLQFNVKEPHEYDIDFLTHEN